VATDVPVRGKNRDNPGVLIESRPRGASGGVATDTKARRSLFAGVRARVLLSFIALLLVSTAASIVVLREVLLSRIDDEIDRELTRELLPVQSLSAQGDPQTGRPFGEVEELLDTFIRRNPPPVDGAFVGFAGGSLSEIRSALPDEAGIATALAGLARTTEPGTGNVALPAGEARYVAIPLDDEGVLVAASLTAADREQVERAVWIAVGVSGVVLLLAGLFIWLAAGRTLAPLKELSQTARAISETDLSGRIAVRGNDEIAQLARTFNGMLDRLQAAFATQKDFLSDVSHELRTPITVIRGYLETLGNSPSERAEATAVVQDELDRMSRYVDDLLLLTQAVRPDFLRPAPVDLDLFTHDLFTKARSLGDRSWRLDGTGIGILLADQQRLTQAVMNLAENAVGHTAPGERIWLGSSLVGSTARLWVRDEGPGVDPVDQERIFERYAQAGARAESGGAGLGLAIVRAVAEGHGGRVELDSAPGVGSTFSIVIPTGEQG
jgi:two-component system, OmpR family, sensor kinase